MGGLNCPQGSEVAVMRARIYLGKTLSRGQGRSFACEKYENNWNTSSLLQARKLKSARRGGAFYMSRPPRGPWFHNPSMATALTALSSTATASATPSAFTDPTYRAKYRGIWVILMHKMMFPSESCNSVSKGTLREFVIPQNRWPDPAICGSEKKSYKYRYAANVSSFTGHADRRSNGLA